MLVASQCHLKLDQPVLLPDISPLLLLRRTNQLPTPLDRKTHSRRKAHVACVAVEKSEDILRPGRLPGRVEARVEATESARSGARLPPI